MQNFFLSPLLLPFFFQHWQVYKDISEIFILVPALLGLKGNLEMTLASRLSTAVSNEKIAIQVSDIVRLFISLEESKVCWTLDQKVCD